MAAIEDEHHVLFNRLCLTLGEERRHSRAPPPSIQAMEWSEFFGAFIWEAAVYPHWGLTCRTPLQLGLVSQANQRAMHAPPELRGSGHPESDAAESFRIVHQTRVLAY